MKAPQLSPSRRTLNNYAIFYAKPSRKTLNKFGKPSRTLIIRKCLKPLNLLYYWTINKWLLNDCSNTSRTYSTSTFTLPVLDLSLSSTMLFVDFMLFLGTTYIMYFYFPKLLEPFWSHLNSSTSTSICLSFYCNNSYENWKFQAL